MLCIAALAPCMYAAAPNGLSSQRMTPEHCMGTQQATATVSVHRCGTHITPAACELLLVLLACRRSCACTIFTCAELLGNSHDSPENIKQSTCAAPACSLRYMCVGRRGVFSGLDCCQGSVVLCCQYLATRRNASHKAHRHLALFIMFFDSSSFGVLCIKHCLGGLQHVPMRASVS